MQIVDGVYKTFVKFLARQGVPGSVPAPIKEWMDLAENILVDSKTSVIKAVKHLEEALTHGDLFRRILQVYPLSRMYVKCEKDFPKVSFVSLARCVVSLRFNLVRDDNSIHR